MLLRGTTNLWLLRGYRPPLEPTLPLGGLRPLQSSLRLGALCVHGGISKKISSMHQLSKLRRGSKEPPLRSLETDLLCEAASGTFASKFGRAHPSTSKSRGKVYTNRAFFLPPFGLTVLDRQQLFVGVHDGISKKIRSLHQLSKLCRGSKESPLGSLESDLLWSDPSTRIRGVRPNVQRKAGVLFGEDLVERVRKLLGIDYIARVHTNYGFYEENHRRCNRWHLQKYQQPGPAQEAATRQQGASAPVAGIDLLWSDPSSRITGVRPNVQRKAGDEDMVERIRALKEMASQADLWMRSSEKSRSRLLNSSRTRSAKRLTTSSGRSRRSSEFTRRPRTILGPEEDLHNAWPPAGAAIRLPVRLRRQRAPVAGDDHPPLLLQGELPVQLHAAAREPRMRQHQQSSSPGCHSSDWSARRSSVKYPSNFMLLRGNHECANINKAYGFYKEIGRRYPRTGARRLFDLFNQVFAWMPFIGLVGEKILCMHVASPIGSAAWTSSATCFARRPSHCSVRWKLTSSGATRRRASQASSRTAEEPASCSARMWSRACGTCLASTTSSERINSSGMSWNTSRIAPDHLVLGPALHRQEQHGRYAADRAGPEPHNHVLRAGLRTRRTDGQNAHTHTN
ncbi:hypothetical protein niasHT_030859 [Heterodera trifolii]|uniref:Serine/threonine-protein phosphatase n=1 Tax=Heterodera trifolii TaxID=157864 RepID=A0ABD2I601_9BILA